MLETADSCDFTLTLLDGLGDGWFGSWLGVIQGDELFGPYEMVPQDGVEVSFDIPLYSGEQVQVLFFTGGNAETTSAQCGFFIEGPQGIVVEGGTNPWNDAIKKFPYRYDGIPFCQDFCIEPVLGCMNPEATNYDPNANSPDGSCYVTVTGCTDSLAVNYNPQATEEDEPSSCIDAITGCMNPAAFNFDPNANTPTAQLCVLPMT